MILHSELILINSHNRSGKRKRPNDEAFFGYCTVYDDLNVSSTSVLKSPSKQHS